MKIRPYGTGLERIHPAFSCSPGFADSSRIRPPFWRSPGFADFAEYTESEDGDECRLRRCQGEPAYNQQRGHLSSLLRVLRVTYSAFFSIPPFLYRSHFFEPLFHNYFCRKKGGIVKGFNRNEMDKYLDNNGPKMTSLIGYAKFF